MAPEMINGTGSEDIGGSAAEHNLPLVGHSVVDGDKRAPLFHWFRAGVNRNDGGRRERGMTMETMYMCSSLVDMYVPTGSTFV